MPPRDADVVDWEDDESGQGADDEAVVRLVLLLLFGCRNITLPCAESLVIPLNPIPMARARRD